VVKGLFGRQSERRVEVHALDDEVLQLGALPSPVELPERDLAVRVREVLDLRRLVGHGHLVEQQPEAPHVDLRADERVALDLGRDVAQGAGHVFDQDLVALGWVHDVRKPKVADLDRDYVILFVSQDVRQLEVSVHDALGVDVAQPLEHLRRQVPELGLVFDRRVRLDDQVVQEEGLVRVLQVQRQLVVVLSVLVHFDHVLVLEGRVDGSFSSCRGLYRI